MTAEERRLYEAVDDYIASTYNQADDTERNAVGFVMTIYRRRLASSFRALRNTLQKHLEAISNCNIKLLTGSDEDAPDDEATDEILDADEAAELERQALAIEEAADIESLLERIRGLPADSKLAELRTVLQALRQDGYDQAMVFTQYTDTMDFLRDELSKDGGLRLMCFSGRGGEVPSGDGSWRRIDRDDAKRRFRNQEAEVLLCTDAAAEGLNFQFCGALVNYDMPWNPMRVEQRIGRIDRLGQQYAAIRIVNLHYEDTVEADVYSALKSRIKLFESVVGRPAADPVQRAPEDLEGCAVRQKPRSDAGGQRNQAAGRGSRRTKFRHRCRDGRGPRDARPPRIAGHVGGSRQGHCCVRADAAGHRGPETHRGPRLRTERARHVRTTAGDHRSSYFQEHAERVWSCGLPGTHCFGHRKCCRLSSSIRMSDPWTNSWTLWTAQATVLEQFGGHGSFLDLAESL